ncbi:phosphopantetheine-binding protein [Paenibacillus pinihumi]|uniref:phosphopantetheine-binding protein n=1 Tax=Paenibacillus pinihumi TaxID=669462 RepID=UPI00049051DA|nr:phosphopantetheine-binding protein [Paenibacillus pinihumi]
MKMQRETIRQKVQEIAGKLFINTEPLEGAPDNFVHTYRMTSIDVLEFLLAIESEYEFEFEDDCLNENTLTDLNLLLNLIEAALKKRIVL